MKRGLGSEVNEQIRALMNADIVAAVTEIRQHLEKLDDVQLNVAITGQTGTSISSFVNYFRGIKDSDEREAIKKPKPFLHPNHSNVTLWDLPGIGSTEFPADEYFQKVGFEKFDFFIIISADRFRENDVKLVKEIGRMGKKFYFVRSKIDHNFRGEKHSQKNFNEEKTLTQIKEDCIKGLRNQGFEDPQVFLLSNFDHHDDPCPLIETFERDLPELKKHALLMAMLSIFLEVINKKRQSFQAESTYYSIISAIGAAVPVPGLSVVVDLSLLTTVFSRYVLGFGLNELSLQRLATSTGVSFDDLRLSIKSTLARKGITTHLTWKLLTQLANTSAIIVTSERLIYSSIFYTSLFCYRVARSWFPFPATGERFIHSFSNTSLFQNRFEGNWFSFPATDEKFSFIQILRMSLAPVLFFTTTNRALNYVFDQLAEDAQRVFKRAVGLDTAV